MNLSSKQNRKNTQNTKKQRDSFFEKRICRKCRLICKPEYNF